MDPRFAIAPTIIIRRRGKKKWHIARNQAGEFFSTMCRQDLRMPEETIAYNAEQVSCSDCLVAAISERNTGIPAQPKEPTYDSEGNLL